MGNAPIELTGVNFHTGGLVVKCGGAGGDDVTSTAEVVNSTTIRCRTSARTAGATTIYVETDDGNDTIAYTYLAADALDGYINTGESTDAYTELADDFGDGFWVTVGGDHVDHGSVSQKGWTFQRAGTAGPEIYGAVRPGEFGSSPYCGTHGPYVDVPPTGARAGWSFSHPFKTSNLEHVWMRGYFKYITGSDGGHEKMMGLAYNNAPSLIFMQYNYFGNEKVRAIPMQHQDDGRPAPNSAWMGANQTAEPTLTIGNWYYYEMEVQLNTPGDYDGVYRFWLDDCGADGQSPPASPTLRGEYTDVKYRGTGAQATWPLWGCWLEAWGNPGSYGECLLAYLNCNSNAQVGLL